MNATLPFDAPYQAKLTVDDFLLLDQTEAFQHYAKTELIDGAIIVMNAQFSEHFTVKNRMYRRLADACDRLGTGLEAWSEGAIGMPPHNVPEPDMFVTTATPVRGLVTLETVALVVEVASSSLGNDLGVKARMYAANGIAEYWVVDVGNRVVHRMWTPADGHYAERDEVVFGDRLAAVTIDGLGIDTDAL